jgi:hypothetical protein
VDEERASLRWQHVGSIGEVALLAAATIAAAAAGEPLSWWALVAIEDLLLLAAMNEVVSPTVACELVLSYYAHLVETGDYAESSVEKAGAQMVRLTTYLERRFGLVDIRDADREHVLAWVHATVFEDERRANRGRTEDNRAWAADLFFKQLRGLGLYGGDPLLDVARAPRDGLHSRPLLDAEAEACRKHARSNLRDTLGPVRVALAEALATTSEIPKVLVADYDPARNRIWLPGHGARARIAGRWSELSPWARAAIEQRIAALGPGPRPDDRRLAYEGKGDPARAEAAVCTALRRVLDRAGLTEAKAPDVKPKSIRAGAARRLYDVTDIELVRRQLGVTRVDTARIDIGLAPPEPDTPPAHRQRP